MKQLQRPINLLSATLLSSVLFCTTTNAMPPSPDGIKSHDASPSIGMISERAGILRLINQLQLSSDQRSQVDKMLKSSEVQVRKLKGGIANKRQEIRTLVFSDRFNKTQFKQLLVERSHLMVQLYTVRGLMHHQIYNLLTKQQKQALSQILTKRLKAVNQLYQEDSYG